MPSKVEICNIALASMGADSIRDFSEGNKRSRMCDVFFDTTRDYLLSRFDWPFARKYVQLNAIADPVGVPDGWYAFQVPTDCKTPRDIAPAGTNIQWRLQADWILVKKSEDVYLYYTAKIMDETKFSDSFSNLLALGIASRIAPTISKDKAVAKMLYSEYRSEQADMWESEANIGSDWVDHDGDPENDSFVTGESFSSITSPNVFTEND